MVTDELESMSGVLNAIADPVLIIDKDFKLVFANNAALDLCGLSRDRVVGKNCHEISYHCPMPCVPPEKCPHQEVFATGRPLQLKHTHCCTEGKERIFNISASPVRDADGRVVQMIEVLRDITETENTARAVQKSEALITEVKALKEQLQHAQKMEAIGTLAGGIAHDFNNILSVIIGYGSLAQMHLKPDDAALPHVRQILVAGERAARLTTGLLAFSREQVMDLRAVKVSTIVADFRKMLGPIIGEDIEFKVVIAQGDLIVQADTGQLEQVLMNLAVNARDAMRHGGTLTIKTGSMTMDSRFLHTHGFGQPGCYATIMVADTGMGMDDATRLRIFEPYFTTKELGRGTGLGLSIAFGIVKQHKGFLECQSDPGKGTTFKIYLPVADTEAGQKEEKDVTFPARGTETILIAEDDTAVRSLTRQLLNEFGYYVIEAVDGEDAVHKFKDNQDRITLLLLDVILPKKNGKEAYEDMKVMRPDIKAIFISGYARDLMQDNGVIDKGPEFLQKPVSPKELLKKIRAVLDR
jgi:PAS domain S-box-containing protein